MSKQSKSSAVSQGIGTSQDAIDLQTEVTNIAESRGFTTLLTKPQKAQARSNRYERSFVDSLLARYEAHPEFAEQEFDVAAMREALTALAAYEAAATAASALLWSIQGQVTLKKGELAKQSNAMFDYLKGLSKTARGAGLRSDVSALTQLRRSKTRKPKTPAVSPVQAASPDAAATK
jgi:hypothetical protein